jgi:membrane associated rhomboid family serine protease
LSNAHFAQRPQTPLVVMLLAGAIIAAFFLTGQYDPEHHDAIFELLAVIPARFDPSAPAHYANWTDALTPVFGHVFAHYGFAHIAMNMIAYLQAAPFLARRLGGMRFLALFFLSALGGAAAFILLDLHSSTAAVGASGAICGLFGAYFLAVRPTPRDALSDPIVRNAIASFLGINVVLMGVLSAMHVLPIAWQAHLGGFFVGALVFLALRPRAPAGPWG